MVLERPAGSFCRASRTTRKRVARPSEYTIDCSSWRQVTLVTQILTPVFLHLLNRRNLRIQLWIAVLQPLTGGARKLGAGDWGEDKGSGVVF